MAPNPSTDPALHHPEPLPASLVAPIKAEDDPRHKQHGTFSQRSIVAQAIKARFELSIRLNENQFDDDQRQALDEIAGKLSRIVCGNPHDPEHWDDIAGYAKLVADRRRGVTR
jgi:hypothetical protein